MESIDEVRQLRRQNIWIKSLSTEVLQERTPEDLAFDFKYLAPDVVAKLDKIIDEEDAKPRRTFYRRPYSFGSSTPSSKSSGSESTGFR
jgi:hypothetical protein